MPWSAIIAETVWWMCVVVYLAIRFPHLRRARSEPVRTSQRDFRDAFVRGFGVLTFAVLPFTYIVTDFPEFATYPFFPPFAAIGAATFLASLWCIHRSLQDLGRGFSPSLEIRHQHQLVTAGIYRQIRHPMYLGFLLWAIAQVMLLPNWIAGPAALVGWIVLFVARVGREEGMMLQEFGDQYRAYMARTARLVPGIF
ncbi:MAG: protein-S-isoprenylcysteine O-methyltransferase [Xanthobacteraceae bacterium]